MSLAAIQPGELSPRLRADLDAASALAAEALAASTRYRYACALKAFGAYCEATGMEPCPATVHAVAAYLANMAGNGSKYSTVSAHRAAIGWLHRTRGHFDPTQASEVKRLMAGAARRIGVAPERQAPAVTSEVMRKILAAIPVSVSGGLVNDRDRAMLAVWFVTGLRASDVARMHIEDLAAKDGPDGAGYLYQLRRSKTDQTGKGRAVAISAGPAANMLAGWLRVLGVYSIKAGPVWRDLTGKAAAIGPEACSEIVARRAAAAGYVGLTGHSMRASHITEASRRGVPIERIARQVGHGDLATTMGYVRADNALEDSSGRGLL